jgi:HSP20 family protein
MNDRDHDAQTAGLGGLEIELHGIHPDLSELLEVKRRIETLAARDLQVGAAGPRADLLDVGDAWQLRLEVPGVELADLELSLQGDELVVAGVRDTVESGARAVFTERPNGPFQRTVRLPGEVDADGVTAHLRGGLLVVDLPKG